MERMPKREKKLVPIAEDLAWLINRVSAYRLRDAGYLSVLSKGKKDIAEGRVPDWEFVELLKEAGSVVKPDDAEEVDHLARIAMHAATLKDVRRTHIDDKLDLMEQQSENRVRRKRDDISLEPPVLPPLTSNESMEA